MPPWSKVSVAPVIDARRVALPGAFDLPKRARREDDATWPNHDRRDERGNCRFVCRCVSLWRSLFRIAHVSTLT